MKKYIFIFTAISILFTACQKVVDANELLDTEEQVFITSYISPQDTVLRVNVSRALPSIGTPLSIQDDAANEAKFLITNAQVSISDEAGNNTILSYSEEEKSYLANANTLPILENQSYFLKVAVDGNEFNASCTIPKKVAEINEQINFRDDFYSGQLADINVAFQDFAGEKNFYILGGLVSTLYQYENEEPEAYTYPLYFESGMFVQANLLDGGILSGNALNSVEEGPSILDKKITLQVAHVEEILFQNLRTDELNFDAEGNPFAEYAIAPNNILDDGAIGVFAGFQLTTKEIQF
jgi:hypothetical protein